MDIKRLIKILGLLCLTACQTPVPECPPTIRYIKKSKPAGFEKILGYDYPRLKKEIGFFLDCPVSNLLDNPETVAKSYETNGYSPNWIWIIDPHRNNFFLNVLSVADSHGLNRNTYHYAQLETNFENLNFFYSQTGKINYPLWAESEVLLTDGLLSLAKHLKIGFFDPLSDNDYHYYIPSHDSIFDPTEIFKTEDILIFLRKLPPSNFQYQMLRGEYHARLGKEQKTKKDLDTLNTLRVNLERWRWNHLFDTNLTVYVNIPAFQLHVLKNDSTFMTSNVCVGRKRPKNHAKLQEQYLKNPYTHQRPILHETPLLKNVLSYIVLNPHWRVPSNIAKNEILRNIQRDSSFLERLEYTVYSGNQQINPYAVNWETVSPLHFFYRFEQSAGEKNVLGKMKFMFPNQFNVYLHDTPIKRDFLLKNRAVSHGCVRVENCFKLSEFLLSDMPKFDSAYVAKTIFANRSTTTEIRPENIFLKTRATLVIDYKTSWINKFGKLEIYPDVYGRDQRVLDAFEDLEIKSSRMGEIL